MTTKKIDLLIVAGRSEHGRLKKLFSQIEDLQINLTWEQDETAAVKLILKEEHDLYLVYCQNGSMGLALIKDVLSKGYFIPFILFASNSEDKIDQMALKTGAMDCLLTEDLNPLALRKAVLLALKNASVIMELHVNEKKYRNLFEQSIDAIFISNREQLLIEVNPSFLKLFKLQKSKNHNPTLKDLFANKEAYQQLNEELLKKRKIKDFDALLHDVDGNKIECNISVVSLFDEDDLLSGYQGLIRDISMRKKAERELLMAEKLSMTGKIARSIAHEVRNPLTNLHLALEQLKEEISAEIVNDNIELYADIIERNAGRIDQLIKDMLNSSKPKELDLEENDLNQILEDAIHLTSDRIKLQGMRVRKNLQQDLPKLMADQEKLKIAFLNIIVNAIEAMEVNEGILEVISLLENGKIKIVIQDNGKGIHKDDLKILFDPFFTGKRSGMGLGLTTTKNIINSHYGEIEVESEINKGTSFMIWFNHFSHTNHQ